MERLPLTTRQREILEYLETFTRDAGYPPTVREICKATGLRSPRSVSQHLIALERKGYIARGREKSRAIRFLYDAPGINTTSDVVRVPLRGRVAAGFTAAVQSAPDAVYAVDRQLVTGANAFMLRVEGESMVDAHVVEGDLIVVDPDAATTSGDIVVARVAGETTVKRFETRGEHQFLVAQNGSAPMGSVEMTPERGDITILGKVVGLIRSVS